MKSLSVAWHVKKKNCLTSSTHLKSLFFFSVCNEFHNSTTGTIRSPNYPNNYWNNAYCQYLIKYWDPATVIEINSLRFDIEVSNYCKYDSVKIYDGETTNATRLGPVNGYPCGYCLSGPSDLTSTGNAVLITFVSNNITTHPGFVITYKGK